MAERVGGIFQARVLEWGAIAFSEGTPINLQVRSTNCAKLWSGMGKKVGFLIYCKPTMTNTLAGKETKGCRLSFGSPWACPMLVPAAIAMLALGMLSYSLASARFY